VISAELYEVPAESNEMFGVPLLRFEIRANAFCHQMVRAITGTLVDIGLGRLRADLMPSVLAACDRTAAGQVAPPHGLTLWDVGYPRGDS
jgi:tRNA pseudouridine38-40 synthase